MREGNQISKTRGKSLVHFSDVHRGLIANLIPSAICSKKHKRHRYLFILRGSTANFELHGLSKDAKRYLVNTDMTDMTCKMNPILRGTCFPCRKFPINLCSPNYFAERSRKAATFVENHPASPLAEITSDLGRFVAHN